MDRVLASEARGCGFDPRRSRHLGTVFFQVGKRLHTLLGAFRVAGGLADVCRKLPMVAEGKIVFILEPNMSTSASPRQFAQPGILAPVPSQAAYLFLSREPGVQPARSRKALLALALLTGGHVLGLSHLFVKSLGAAIPGHRAFVQIPGAKVDLPVTQADLVVWLRGTDQGLLFHAMRDIARVANGVLKVDAYVQAFKHLKGHDLTGFEDGTENPKGSAATQAALNADGASFMAVQQWHHHFEQFDALNARARNHAIGRDLKTNAELDKAPVSAHVKRTAQESFAPEAFVLRRSMPWTQGKDAGLMFVAFGASFDAFEAQLRRMSGAEDGVIDGLFSFTRPLGGGYFWCPPVTSTGALDLSVLGV
jgi:porphyrinogen peroxidase